MKKLYCLLSAMIVLAMLVLPVNPLQGAETSGKWGLGLQGGACKLVLTDHSDLWTLGWLAGADFKYGITPKFAIGVEGSWRQHYLADLSTGTRMTDGARLTTSSITDGPRQRNFTAGLFAEYHFLADKSWSPFVCAGSGIYIWKWADKGWNTLSADSASSGSPFTRVDHRIPKVDNAGKPYDLKDQQLYAMAGLGLEIYPSQALSFELGAKFRYLTSLLSSFTGDKDIVGTEPGKLDLPKGIAELYAGVTLYFGGKKCPPSACTASGNPTSGTAPLTVQFDGSASGGCPDYTYAWNFGDGNSSSDQNPSHTYETVGDYFASLTVTDSKGTTSGNSVSVTVSCPQLTCTASGNPTSGTVPLTVQFNGSANGGCPPVIYSWSFGDGGSGSDQSPSHIYQKAGDYTASLTVTDSKGNTCQKNLSIKGSAEEFIPTPEKPVILRGVNFEFDKAILLKESTEILDRVAASLLAHPEVKVEVAGHCDSKGSDTYNLKLSDRRAKAVRDYLIKKGLPATQLTANGYGESQPIADNKTAEGRAENRRVELKRM
jgi:outer membrane protein OmpA-like peptidoglycan-associated protein